MAGNNRCGSAYCAKGYTSEQVAECIASLPDDWEGMCAYQKGNLIIDGTEKVINHCCAQGCDMTRAEYARWNSLCAFTEGRNRVFVPSDE